jgi:hypothetical protein
MIRGTQNGVLEKKSIKLLLNILIDSSLCETNSFFFIGASFVDVFSCMEEFCLRKGKDNFFEINDIRNLRT